MTVQSVNGSEVIEQVTNQINTILYSNKLQPHAVYVKLVGSTFIVGEGQDFDVAVCTPGISEEDIEELRHYLRKEEDYEVGGSGAHWGKGFESLKSGDINVLLYNDWETFYNMLTASRLCRSLHSNGIDMSDKDLRVHIHRYVMGEIDEEAIFAD